MKAEKMAEKSESVRLPQSDVDWLDHWEELNGQGRSQPMRAGLKLLRLMLKDLDQLVQIRLVARLARVELDDLGEQEADTLAVLLVRAAVKAEKPTPDNQQSTKAEGRKRGKDKG